MTKQYFLVEQSAVSLVRIHSLKYINNHMYTGVINVTV